MKPKNYLTTDVGVTADIADQFRKRRKTMAALSRQEGSNGIRRNDLNELMQLAESKALARRLSTT
jgi:CBS-domain-containing membrane protein